MCTQRTNLLRMGGGSAGDLRGLRSSQSRPLAPVLTVLCVFARPPSILSPFCIVQRTSSTVHM